MQCTAKAKSTGVRCRRRAVTGYTVCQVHGAGSPLQGRPGGRPITTGKHSKYLPNRLIAQYEEARQDPDLIALRDEIALLDTRLMDLLKRVDSGESGALWRELRAAWAEVESARRSGDGGILAECLTSVGNLIKRGYSDYVAWSEIGRVVDQRRKVTESERRRLVDMQQMITAERLMILVTALISVIREHVSDRRVLSAIGEDIRRLISSEDSG